MKYRTSDSVETGTTTFERTLNARLIMSIVASGIMSFSGVVVETAMNVTFPTLMQEFSISTETVQWLTTSYLLVLAAIVPTSSFLNKRFHTKAIFIAAMVFYIAGILFGFTAQSFPMLLVGRVFEGVGTGIALPLMFNIITEQAPERHIGVMMGIGTFVTAMAPAVGPSLGGWLAETFGWRMIFAALLPVLAVAFMLGVCSIRQSHPIERPSFDFLGWVSIAFAFATLVLGVNNAGSNGLTHPITMGLFAACIVLVIAFVLRERNAHDPLIKLSVFRTPAFVLGLITLVIGQFIVLGLSFLLPNYAQLVMGAGETEAGATLLAGCILGAIMTPFSGGILDRLGPRAPILTGLTTMTVALILLTALSTSMPTTTAMIIYADFAFGQSLTLGNTMTTALAQLPVATKSDGNAVINTLQQLAGAMGTSVVTLVVGAAQAGASDMALATMNGTRTAYMLLTVLILVPIVCMVVMFFKLGVGKRQ